MTESHFLPSKEDASMTVLALCGSKDSRSESLVARKASWHRSRCERSVWTHVLKDRMPRPPNLTGRAIWASSMAWDDARDAAARILCTELARDASRVPRGVPSRQSTGNAANVAGRPRW
jgi:hypothetical protein